MPRVCLKHQVETPCVIVSMETVALGLHFSTAQIDELDGGGLSRSTQPANPALFCCARAATKPRTCLRLTELWRESPVLERCACCDLFFRNVTETGPWLDARRGCYCS
jgi:hypothetical protein